MAEPKAWFAVDVRVTPEAAEAVEFAFNELGCLGTEIDSLRKAAGAPLTVTGYFDSEPNSDDVAAAVDEALRIFQVDPAAADSIAIREVAETDWLAEWKKHWKAAEVGQFVIAPPWEPVENSDKLLISIEPNMAFGTGTHETTQLCLLAIGDNYTARQTFLDVGTGTGILAIAAAKLGGSNIVAYDTDADSITIARENAEANGVAGRIKFHDGPIGESTQRADLVCANLTLDVIVPLLPLLIDKTNDVLLLSGILVEQEHLITTELEREGIRNIEVARAGEWISVLVRTIAGKV